MTVLALSGLTGEGNYDLGAILTIYQINHVATFSSPRIRMIGTYDPRGVWHAGGYGLGTFPGDTINPADARNFWWTYIHFDSEALYFPTFGVADIAAPSFWWRLVDGVSLDVEIMHT